jgi:hypothetical protein
MPHDIIDRQDALSAFDELMQAASQYHVLRLLGDAKMGKTHLVAKVFPQVACTDHHARCAVIDLRNPNQTAPDFLDAASSQLGGPDLFSTYHHACAESLSRPRVKVQNLQATLARVSVSAPDTADEASRLGRYLTTVFVNDLRKLNMQPVVLLFDAVNEATKDVQAWLMDLLLVQICALHHIRVVVAGRSVPDASASYSANCRTCVLSPVTAEDEYIAFCHRARLTLSEQSIRDLARFVGYTPGLFVEGAVAAFGSGRTPHA